MSGPVTAMTQFMFENPDKLRGGNLEQEIAQRWPSVTVEQVRQALESRNLEALEAALKNNF